MDRQTCSQTYRDRQANGMWLILSYVYEFKIFQSTGIKPCMFLVVTLKVLSYNKNALIYLHQ